MNQNSHSNNINPVPNHPTQNSVVDHYLCAVNEASRRSRITLIIMVTASVLAFAGFWNSMNYNWLNKRIAVAKTANDWVNFTDDTTSPELSDELKGVQTSIWGMITENMQESLPPGVDFRIPPGIVQDFKENKMNSSEIIKLGQKDIIQCALRYIHYRNINTRYEMQLTLEALKQIEQENILVIHIPFFGVSFDINDLGLWSGIAFIIILFMFRFSLARELKNVQYVFTVARKLNVLETYYELMSMYQVFTVPRTKDNTEIRIAEKLPICLFALPLLVYTGVVIHDFCSLYAGFSISYLNTYITIVTNVLFLLIIFKSTSSCFNIWKKMNKEWKNQAYNLRIITKT